MTCLCPPWCHGGPGSRPLRGWWWPGRARHLASLSLILLSRCQSQHSPVSGDHGKSASELVTISDQHLWQLCLLCLTRRFVRQGSIQIAWFVGKIFHSEFSGFDKNHKVNGNLLLLDIWISHKEEHLAPRKAKWNKSAEPRPQHWEQSFSCYE